MNCPNDEKLAAHAADDLSEPEQEQVEEHLNQCRSCRSEHHQYSQLLKTLHDRERPDVDSAFVQRVMNEAEYHQLDEQSDRSTDIGWFPKCRLFIRRNAPWIASLSLHCCLIFLVLLLAVNQFTDTDGHGSDEEMLTGVPVISMEGKTDAETYRDRILWRERLRHLRTGKSSADRSPCPDDDQQSSELNRLYEKLVSASNRKGYWTVPNDESAIKATSLAVLSLLRGGYTPDQSGNERSVAAQDGLAYVIEQQQDSGRIGPNDAPISVHATATAALLEASLFTSSIPRHKSALNALEYLVRRLARARYSPPGYWTLVSLKLGATLNHPKAGELLRNIAQEKGTRTDVEIPADLMVRPFLDASALSNRQKKQVKSLLDHWTSTLNKNETPVLESDQAVALSHLVFTMNDPEIRWPDVRDKLKKRVKLDSLERPSRIARYALILQACRSYPR